MSPSPSFDLDAPDHFTAGAVGPPGQRVFYFQARQARRLVTLKSEKQQVRALADYLAELLRQKPVPAAEVPRDLALLEPVEAVWAVASLSVGYDEDRDRILVEAAEMLEEEEAEEGEEEGAEATAPGSEPATARFRITRGQAAAFVERARDLMKAGRPLCRICTGPIDPDGHVCPRSNGHLVH